MPPPPPPPPPHRDDDCEEPHPAGQKWVEQEVRDLRRSIHEYQLKYVEALALQTKELVDRINLTQKDTAREVGEAVVRAEQHISDRVDKVEATVAENERKADEVKKELSGVNVKVAVWCAVGTFVGTVVTAVTAGIIIHWIGK